MNSVLNEVVRAGLYGTARVETRREKFVLEVLDLGLNPGLDPLKLR